MSKNNIVWLDGIRSIGPESKKAAHLSKSSCPYCIDKSEVLFLRRIVEEIIADLIDAMDRLDAHHADLEPDVDGEIGPDDEASVSSPEWRPSKVVNLQSLGSGLPKPKDAG